MSARAVLNTAYTLMGRRADEADRLILLSGRDPDTATHREQLDAAVSATVDIDPGDGATNVVELRAWVEKVNSDMRDG